jgi:hypothetical protein
LVRITYRWHPNSRKSNKWRIFSSHHEELSLMVQDKMQATQALVEANRHEVLKSRPGLSTERARGQEPTRAQRRQHLKLASDRMKIWHDSLVSSVGYKEGMKGKSPKLQSSWEGPYRAVNQKNSVVYKIQQEGAVGELEDNSTPSYPRRKKAEHQKNC